MENFRCAGSLTGNSNTDFAGLRSANYEGNGAIVHPGERTFTKTDPEDETPYDKLVLGWECDDRYYAIIAILGENLEEATLEKIACAVGSD